MVKNTLVKPNSLRDEIFSKIRTEIPSCNLCTDTELDKILFLHPNSHRLTAKGCMHVGTVYTPYPFQRKTEYITARQLLAICRNIKWPFYISRNSLILFSPEDAFLLKLCGNDVDLWVKRITKSEK